MASSPWYLAARAYGRGRLLAARLRREVDWSGTRILGYHSISDDQDELAVTPAAFREQMERVLEADARPVALEDLPGLSTTATSERTLCVTFDDGYRNNAEHAVPVLRELGIPATIFLPTHVVDGTAPYTWFRGEAPPALSWDEVATLERDPLIDFQSHTLTHPRLPHLADDEAWREIGESKRELEARLQRPVTSLCYPAGLFGDRERAYARDAGYRMALSTEPGVNGREVDPFALRRTMIYLDDRVGDFALKLSGRLDRPPRLRAALYRRLARG